MHTYKRLILALFTSLLLAAGSAHAAGRPDRGMPENNRQTISGPLASDELPPFPPEPGDEGASAN